MNYLVEINAFFKHIKTNPVSPSASALWHTLMHINNEAGWRKQFTVAATLLCSLASLSDSSFKRARKELVEKGYIRYYSRGGNQAAIYQIVSLSSTMNYKTDDKAYQNTNHNPTHNPAPLIKQKKKNKDQTSSSISFYENNFGQVYPYIESELQEWNEKLNEALVIEALKIALDYNKRNWSYVKKILSNWLREGITSVEQIKTDRKQQQKKLPYNKPASKRQEVIPEWFLSQRASEEDNSHEDDSDVTELLNEYIKNKKSRIG